MPRQPVDEQVVKMTFDNSNFDSNIDSSIKSLNKLDGKLNSLDRNNFDVLTASVESLAKTFSVKGRIISGVLFSLGNEIVNLGKKVKNSLVRGVKDGLREYELLINSTQTIYENVRQSGKTLSEVNDSLDELNEYADKTIYNFSEMTRMIGMFTSAGVGLNSSVKTIKGLANAAALVGANSQKAEIAWRAVSRAMSSGKFTLVTWKSLELSNIAGKQFQTVIKDVAKAHGINIDKMIKKQGSFRDTLKKGWLTNDIFTEAMKIMSGDMSESELRMKGYSKNQIKELMSIAESAQEAATRVKSFKQLMETTGEAIGSGWAQSFRILIGDLQQARKLYTRISEVLNDFIDNNSNIRNDLFSKIMNFKDKELYGSWKSGRDSFEQTIENILASITTFLKTIKTGFLNIFPVDRIAAGARKVLNVIEKFTRIFVINSGKVDKAGKKLWNISDVDKMTDAIKDLIKFFRGLASVVDIAWMTISQPLNAIIKRIPFFNNFFDNVHNNIVGFIGQLGKFGDKITVVRDAAKEFNIFGAAVDYLIDNFDEIAGNNPAILFLINMFNRLKETVFNLKDSFDKLEIKPLTTLFGIFKMIVTGVFTGLNKLSEILLNISSKVDWSWLEKPKKFLGDILKIFYNYGKGLITFKEATASIASGFKNIWSSIFEVISKIPYKDILSRMFSGFKRIFKTVSEIAGTLFNGVIGKLAGNKKVVTVSGKAQETFSNIEIVLDKTNTTVKNLSNGVTTFSNGLERLAEPLKSAEESIYGIYGTIDDVLNSSGPKVDKKLDFIEDRFGKFGKNIEETSKDTINDTISNVGGFLGFIKSIPAKIAAILEKAENPFKNISKNIALIGGGVAAVVLTIKSLVKAVEGIQIVRSINSLIGAGTDVLKAYQRQVESKAILNLAITIGILASVLITMAFIPYEKMENGLIMFTSFIATLGLALPPILNAMAKYRESVADMNRSMAELNKSKIVPKDHLTNVEAMSNVLHNLINSQKEIAIQWGKEFAKGVNARMFGKAIKDIAIAVLILVGALIALKYTMSIDELKEYGAVGAAILGSLVGAMEILIITLKAFELASRNVASSVKVFSSFFSLAGLSGVILAIAAATAILSSSLIMLSKANPENLKAAMEFYFWIFGTLSAVMIIIAAITKNASSTGKLKKITLSITGALLGLAVVFKVLSGVSDWTIIASMTAGMAAIFASLGVMIGIIGRIVIPDNLNKLTSLIATIGLIFVALAGSISMISKAVSDEDNPNKWVGILSTLGGLFILLTSSIIPLVEVSKHVGNDPGIWTRLQVTVVVMANAMLAMAGAVNILGKTKKVPLSTFALLGAMIGIIGALIAVAVAVSSAGGVFSDSFVRAITFIGAVVTSISLAISVSVVAMTTLVNAFNKIDFSAKDVGTISKSITDKLSTAGAIILTALPQIIELFSKIGHAAGSVFIAFTTSFFQRLAETGDQYAKLADTIVNTILNIANKVIDVLYTRKDELNQLVEKIVTIVSGVITAAMNAVWRRGEGVKQFTEEEISRALGFTAVLGAASTFGSKFNNIYNSIKNASKSVSDVLNGFNKIIQNGSKNVQKLVFADYVAIGIGAAAAYGAMQTLYHGLKQMSGEEAAYFDANVNSWSKALLEFATNSKFAAQVAIGGAGEVGDKIVRAFMLPVYSIIALITKTMEIITGIILKPGEYVLRFFGLFDKRFNEYADHLKNFVKWFGDKADWATNSVIRDAMITWNEGTAFSKTFDKSGTSKELYDEVKLQTESIDKGMQAGLSDYSANLSNILHNANTNAIETIAGDWDIHSPSKVAEKLYGNVVKGAIKGLKNGTKELREVFSEANIAMATSIRNMSFEVDDGSNGKKKLELNRQLLELTEKQTDAIVGKSREEVYAYLTEKANLLGLMDAETQAANLTSAIFSQQQDQTKLKLQSINAVTNATKVSIDTIMSDQTAANAIVLANTLQNNLEMANIARDHASELVGLNKEKAQQLLKDEAMARGMSEEDAEQSSKKMVAMIIAQQKSKTKITANGIKNAAKLMDDEVDAYKAMLEKETAALEDALKTRSEMQEKVAKKIAEGQYKDISSMLADIKPAEDAYSRAKYNYQKAVDAIGKDLINENYANQKQWENEYKKALNSINKSKSASRGGFTNILSGFINKVKDGIAGALDLDSWKKKFDNDNNNNTDDNDNKNKVKAAKNLKSDLEKNRADLTPTFDLDKLSDEAKKANGIVMSSLMAAQNASIGDYINKDSELNPFMKDRWQNVYNFTQNNYSPKALSRTDIYRQTQRQLKLSRGF